MKLVFKLILMLSAGVLMASIAWAESPSALKDGELPFPTGYKAWPKFLSAVQRPDAKQVREIYVNLAGTSATAAGGFPNGTMFVMENYAAQTSADGTLKTDAEGKLVKGDLLRVFVMGKDAGWGMDVPKEQQTGNWIYATYQPDGQKAPDDLGKCRACHLAMPTKDFVHRYDEYFNQFKTP